MLSSGISGPSFNSSFLSPLVLVCPCLSFLFLLLLMVHSVFSSILSPSGRQGIPDVALLSGSSGLLIIIITTTCEAAQEKSCLKMPVSIFLRHWYEKVSGFCTGTNTPSLHKMAVWSDVSPWCSFVEIECYHFAWKTLSRADGLCCE